MRNFCDLIGLEQLYFSGILALTTRENYKTFGGSSVNK